MLAVPARLPAETETAGPAVAPAAQQGTSFQSNLLRFLDRREILRQIPDPYMIALNRSLESGMAWAGSMALDAASLFYSGPLGQIGAILHAMDLNRIGPQSARFQQKMRVAGNTVRGVDWVLQVEKEEFGRFGIGFGKFAVQQYLDPIATRGVGTVTVSRTTPYSTVYWDGATRTHAVGQIDYTLSYTPAPGRYGPFNPPDPLEGTYSYQFKETSRIQSVNSPFPAGGPSVMYGKTDWGGIAAQAPRIEWNAIPRTDWNRVFDSFPKTDWNRIRLPSCELRCEWRPGGQGMWYSYCYTYCRP